MVGDGREAVEAWSTGEWDIILMDVQMPVMDGPTATRIIRAQEESSGRCRTPIIALTANTMSHQITEYLDCGMDDFVGKPFQYERLIEAIAAGLQGAEAPAQGSPSGAAPAAPVWSARSSDGSA